MIFDFKGQVGESIPKIIHQTGPWELSDLPPILHENINKLKAINHGWTHIYYSDLDQEQFIRQEYNADILAAFKSIDHRLGPARADLFRYLVIHRYGGVYLDIKSTARNPLDQVISSTDTFILTQWLHETEERKAVVFRKETRKWGFIWRSDNITHEDLSHIDGGEFVQWFIASSPGHPFLKGVIRSVLSNIKAYNPILHGYGKAGVVRVTGPIAYSLSIEALLPSTPYRYLRAKRDLGLEYSVLPKKQEGGRSDDMFGSHHDSLFRQHYSKVHVPVVQLSTTKKAIVLCLWPIVALFILITGRKGY